MVWVKICGTTNLEDALAAVDAGADALGFVFAESPRRVEPSVVAHITRALPEGIERIGVFVDETAGRIDEIVAEAGLTAVQLHGDESLDVAEKLAGDVGATRISRVIPVLPMRRILEMAARGGVAVTLSRKIDTVLIDSAAQGKRGGSGQAWDWEAGKFLLGTFRDSVRIIVAGGLTPANVADAIRTLRPWGVDVSSGVEREPGKKDIEKVRAFVKAAKGVEL